MFRNVIRAVLLVALTLVLAACDGGKKSGQSATATALPPTGTPPPQATAFEVAEAFLTAWHDGRYSDMYDLLSAGSKQAIARDRFVARHEGIRDEATIQGVNVEIRRPADPESGRVSFTAVTNTALWGDVRDDNILPLARGADGWRVEWAPSLIFSRLTGANLVRTIIDAPKRGAILDRGGRALAFTGSVPTIGTSKNIINAKQNVRDREGLLQYLSQRIGLSVEQIRQKIDDPKTDVDVFIPLQTLAAATPDALVTELENTPGVLVQRTPRRIYPYGSTAAHVVGYVAPVTAEQLATLRSGGYTADDLVGATGLEGAYEKVLAGSRGARLTIVTPEGSVVTELASRPSQPSQDVITALDVGAQQAAEAALGDRTGSIVLLDPRDSSVIAMASHPTFDPNAFVTGLSSEDAGRLLNDPRRPLLNRAIGSTYPPGSTFKVITGAAGLERAGLSPMAKLPCPPVWGGLGPNFLKKNWVNYSEGDLTVAEALMRSCNPVFYEIALRLDKQDANILPSIAAGFGLGRPTGLNGLEEASGVDPNPEWKQRVVGESWFSGDSVNMGIGQGFLLTTPLQIANAYAAIARGGVLRAPVLVRELRETVSGRSVNKFEGKETGRLPISAATLNVIRQGTYMVAQDPRGTAYSVFRGSTIDPAGKSGTAEDQGLQSHVLFAAYAPRNDAKGVAVVVLDEGESGSLEAGPITRQALEAWLRGGG